ncbi:integral membrane protein [Colletotrichum karsti]|uniref:Integral membrane protein n=1 Tax=Colletotrichum karsti TaxID=1095194 RepID=A0A9P6HZ41_9PEZI|nr:uncharacterized protein CkaCkLH20_10730 [Colletotrichum karsti]KAF9871796.1 integral membrane protein [Colletotrichum karsti]
MSYTTISRTLIAESMRDQVFTSALHAQRPLGGALRNVADKFNIAEMNESIDRYDSDNSPYSIRPLPPVLRHGLAAVATMGFISFFTSLGLLMFLTYKLISWHNGPPKEVKKDPIAKVESPAPTDAVFIIPSEWTASRQEQEKPMKETWIRRAINEPPNQFLVLIFNLLLADIQQALAFLLNVEWLTRNAIEVGTGTCWTQGWFVSTGDLASSVFITGIAIHTYMSIVRAKQLPTWAFHTAIIMMWGFVYGTGIMGIIVTDNGKNDGGLYVRAGAWCWINSKYQDIRLTLHYLWIFISLIVTTVIYFIIFLHLQRIARRSGGVVPCCTISEPEAISSESANCGGSSLSSNCGGYSLSSTCGRHLPGIPDYARQHTFLLYPLVYVVCTSPLAAGRLASMAGHEVSLMYFCFAGAMIASNGWLDVVLYSSTRRSIVFAADGPPSQETGLETFAFMCPQPPKFGNTTIVTGGIELPKRSLRGKWNERMTLKGPKSGSLRGLKVDGSTSTDSMRGFGMGEGSVMGMAIQCETVTTVSVEVNTRPQVTRPKLAALGRKTSDMSSFSGTSTSSSRRSLGD